MKNQQAQALAYLSWANMTDKQKAARTAKARAARAKNRKQKEA